MDFESISLTARTQHHVGGTLRSRSYFRRREKQAVETRPQLQTEKLKIATRSVLLLSGGGAACGHDHKEKKKERRRPRSAFAKKGVFSLAFAEREN